MSQDYNCFYRNFFHNGFVSSFLFFPTHSDTDTPEASSYERSPQIRITDRLACLQEVGMGPVPGVSFCFVFPLCASRKTLKMKLKYSVMDKVDILRCQQIHDSLKLHNTTTSTAPSSSFLCWLATRPHTSRKIVLLFYCYLLSQGHI